jgi:hypothetical protein
MICRIANPNRQNQKLVSDQFERCFALGLKPQNHFLLFMYGLKPVPFKPTLSPKIEFFKRAQKAESKWHGSKIRSVVTPVQDAFAHDVVEADGDEAEVDEHFPKAEEARAGDVWELAIDDGPGHHENHFHVEEDKEDGDEIEANAEAALSVACGLNAAFIGGQFDFGVAMAANEPRGDDDCDAKENGGENLQEERKILPVIRSRIHRPA